MRKALGDSIEEDIDDRGRVERKNLAEQQTSHHGDSERTAQFRPEAGSESEWKSAEQRGHGGHHDGPKAQQACLKNGLGRRFTSLAFSLKRKIDNHDAVFLHDADQQDDSNDGHYGEILVANDKCEQRTDSCRRQGGQNRDRVNETLIENAQNDVNGDQRRENQQ